MNTLKTVKYFLYWTLFLCAISLSNSSSGDRSRPFRTCLTRSLALCNNDKSYPGALPLYLLVFGWRCSDECKYVCMHNVTNQAVAKGWNIEQFYGKVSSLPKFVRQKTLPEFQAFYSGHSFVFLGSRNQHLSFSHLAMV
jgi:hypothetical protein